MVSIKQQGKMYGALPTIQLGPNDLSVVDSALKGYLAYLRGRVPPSQKRDERIHLLQSVRLRLAPMLLNSTIETGIPLTGSEIEALNGALSGFARLVRQTIPPSKERDETLEVFEDLRQALVLSFKAMQPN